MNWETNSGVVTVLLVAISLTILVSLSTTTQMASCPFWVWGRLRIKFMDILSHLLLGISAGWKSNDIKSFDLLMTFSHIVMYSIDLSPIELSGSDENECAMYSKVPCWLGISAWITGNNSFPWTLYRYWVGSSFLPSNAIGYHLDTK